jgi:hypothetical protein
MNGCWLIIVPNVFGIKAVRNMETKLSKTGEGELLIHKEDGKGGFINIIVDSDGDIEIMHITSDRSQTWNKVSVSVDEAIKFWNDN